MQLTLNSDNLREATNWLTQRDASLALVYHQFGYPPIWSRQPGFSTLTHIILEQQVSLASANAAFARLEAQLGGKVTPSGFLSLDEVVLREKIGYSRQKIGYTRGLAESVVQGSLDLEGLSALPDEAVMEQLTALKGIGAWTAQIYLSECLLRPDILPKGDIALLEAFRQLKGLDARPDHTTFVAGTEHWRPWRSVGIRMLWHYYLNK
jgi:DNA-3-methyladenine glycosylase II